MKKLLLLLAAIPTLAITTGANASGETRRFLAIEDGWLDQPETISTAAVRQVLIGMSKHQVYHILGEPHFNEGIGARTWNYAFDLRGDPKSPSAVCQLRIEYDDGRIMRMDWDREYCAKLLQ